MREPLQGTFETLKASTQKTLIQFLYTDLDLAFTFVWMAKAKAGRDADHYKSLLEKARIALECIRRFQGRVEDPGELQKIHERANGLEAAINVLPVSGRPTT